MARPNNKGARARVRAMVLTLTAIFAVAIFLPALMGAMGAWNQWIADHDGRSFMVRTPTDIITEDTVNATLDGDIIAVGLNSTGDVVYFSQDIIWGNSTNSGYHTILLDYGDEDIDNTSGITYWLRMPVSGQQMRANNTVSWVLELEGADCDFIFAPYMALVSEDMIDSMTILTGFPPTHTITADGNFTSFQVNISFLDIITMEDSLGAGQTYLIFEFYTTGTFDEGTELNFRAYDISLNSMGTVNSEAGFKAILFTIGLCFIGGAALIHPAVEFSGPPLRERARSVKNKVSRSRSKKAYRPSGRYRR